MTSHAAFGYLAARYGLTQLALEGLSPEAEPSPKALAKLIGVVRRSQATTVFFETLVSPKLAQTVARNAHVKTAVLDPLEGLTPDAARARSDLLHGHAQEPERAPPGARLPVVGAAFHQAPDQYATAPRPVAAAWRCSSAR